MSAWLTVFIAVVVQALPFLASGVVVSGMIDAISTFAVLGAGRSADAGRAPLRPPALRPVGPAAHRLIVIGRESGLMELREIQVILDGPSTTRSWRETVQARLDAIDRQHERLAAAGLFCPPADVPE